ncbi:MAG: endospore coat-associated protein [Paenibacillus sp.]|nr:endospore coat-associated protein [Paenibacillus sp.]
MNDRKKRSYVGIMVCQKQLSPPFSDQRFYSRLCRIGLKLGMVVFVFFPNRFMIEEQSVEGYTLLPGEDNWSAGRFPLPQVVYDRCFYTTRSNYGEYRECIRKLKEHPDIRFLGYGLKGKWDVHQMLMRHESLRTYLPDTKKLLSHKTLKDELNRSEAVFLKPEAGSQGKGVLRLTREGGFYHLLGRNRRNERIERTFQSERFLLQWLSSFIAGRPYLVQPYLLLNTRDGDPFDVRCLMQKNRKGIWEVAGIAVRRGKSGNVTSNLHGGGVAVELMPFLLKEFGQEKASRIHRTLLEIATQIPETLEQHHGRLAELGIDLGIDTSGNIWILEANSKPGRSAFTHFSDPAARIASIRNPIYYARYLLDTTRRVIS